MMTSENNGKREEMAVAFSLLLMAAGRRYAPIKNLY